MAPHILQKQKHSNLLTLTYLSCKNKPFIRNRQIIYVKSRILFISKNILRKPDGEEKYLSIQVSQVVQERAEGPEAPSPGQRPGYISSQQGAL